jgi:hypothetical protein
MFVLLYPELTVTMSWAPVLAWTDCVSKSMSIGLAVSLTHDLVLVPDSGFDNTWSINQYSLTDGSLLRSFTGGCATVNLAVSLVSLCMCPPDDDTFLVSVREENAIEQRRTMDGTLLRCIGIGVLTCPTHLDCNGTVIVVIESSFLFTGVCVLSLESGAVLCRVGAGPPSFSSPSPRLVTSPRTVRLLADGSGFVVVDTAVKSLLVVSMQCVLQRAIRNDAVTLPADAIEWSADGGGGGGGSFVVVDSASGTLVQLSSDGAFLGSLADGSRFDNPMNVVALPAGGFVVTATGNGNGRRVCVFRGMQLRSAWITACVCVRR